MSGLTLPNLLPSFQQAHVSHPLPELTLAAHRSVDGRVKIPGPIDQVRHLGGVTRELKDERVSLVFVLHGGRDHADKVFLDLSRKAGASLPAEDVVPLGLISEEKATPDEALWAAFMFHELEGTEYVIGSGNDVRAIPSPFAASVGAIQLRHLETIEAASHTNQEPKKSGECLTYGNIRKGVGIRRSTLRNIVANTAGIRKTRPGEHGRVFSLADIRKLADTHKGLNPNYADNWKLFIEKLEAQSANQAPSKR